MYAPKELVEKAMSLTAEELCALLSTEYYGKVEVVDHKFLGFNGSDFVYSVLVSSDLVEFPVGRNMYISLKRAPLSRDYEFTIDQRG